MDMAILAQLIGIENTKVDKHETELKTLGELQVHGMASELKPRVKWCLDNVMASHARIEKYEAQSGRLKKVLMEKF